MGAGDAILRNQNFFCDYCVSPNFFVVLGLRLWLRLGLGCENYSFLFGLMGGAAGWNN